MSQQLVTKETVKAVNAARMSAPGSERRRARRVRMEMTARVRPYYETPELSEELLKAKNISQHGFYFVSRRRGYREDMNLYVACPAGHSQTQADAEGGRVVRVDSLGEDSWGVAVVLFRNAVAYHCENSFQRRG